MTKEKLLDIFDYRYGYTREFLSELIDSAMRERHCAKATDVICDKISYYLPGHTAFVPKGDPDREKQVEYMEWRDVTLFDNNWLDHFKELWKSEHGMVRSKEEACKLAADQWYNHMFVSVYQDNGGGNDNLTMLGMYLKVNAQERITEKMKKRVWEGLYNFYFDHYDKGYYYKLSVDYYPCGWLSDILINAGIDKNDVDSICPWKSYLKIDKDDNSIFCYWYNSDKEIL